MNDNNVLVRIDNVSKVYGSKDNPVYALKDVSLEVYGGEYLSIMGPSGSGKTTLFNMIGGLDRCSSGIVEIGGVNINKLKDSQLAYVRGRHIGYIFQAYNLIMSMTALKNVELPALLAGMPPDQAHDRAVEVLTMVGLEHRLDHRPGELSGGQQQRVAIARALVNSPTIILADEPTGNLDLSTGEEIITLLRKFCKELGVTIITATHDHKMLKVSDRIIWVRDGTVEKTEKVSDLDIDAGGIDESEEEATA